MSALTAVTELGSSVGGFIAGCGEASLLVLLNAKDGRGTSPAEVTSLIQQAVNAHQTTGQWANSGQITPGGLAWLAQANGLTLQQVPWLSALTHASPSQPVLIGVNNATAFGGPDASVYGHYVTVVGTDPTTGNFIVSDPNTPQSVKGQFVQYSLSQFQAARPFSAQIPASPLSPAPGGGTGTSGTTLGFNPIQAGVNFLLGIQSSALSAAQVAVTDMLVGATNGTTVVQGIFGTHGGQDFLWRMFLYSLGTLLIIIGIFFILQSAMRAAAPAVMAAAEVAA